MAAEVGVPPNAVEVARQFGLAEVRRRERGRRPRRERDWLWHACDRCWRTSDHEFIYEEGWGDEKQHYCLGHLPDKFARGYMLEWHHSRREYAHYRLARMRLWRDAHPKDEQRGR